MGLNCPVSMELMVFRETPANCASWVWDSHVTETGPDSGAAPDLKVDFESAGRKVWTRIIFMKEELKIRRFCREDTEEQIANAEYVYREISAYIRKIVGSM